MTLDRTKLHFFDLGALTKIYFKGRLSSQKIISFKNFCFFHPFVFKTCQAGTSRELIKFTKTIMMKSTRKFWNMPKLILNLLFWICWQTMAKNNLVDNLIWFIDFTKYVKCEVLCSTFNLKIWCNLAGEYYVTQQIMPNDPNTVCNVLYEQQFFKFKAIFWILCSYIGEFALNDV